MSLRPPLSLPRAVLPLLALAAATAATRAGAQTATLTLDVNGSQSASANKKDCDVTLKVNWAINTGGSPPCTTDGDLVIWVTKNTTCASAPATGDQTVGSVTADSWASQPSGSMTFLVKQLPVFPTTGAICPPTPDVVQTMRVCGFAKYATFGTGTCAELKAAQPPTILYDSEPPAKPEITAIDPQDSALLVHFNVTGTDVASVTAAYQDLAGEYHQTLPVPASNGAVLLSGLTNGVEYAVQVIAQDGAGNDSERSDIATGTPVQSYGFFALYQQAGGHTDGGCAAAPAGACPLLALGWLWRRRRVRGGVRA